MQTPDICVILNTRSGRRREAVAQLEAAFSNYSGRFTLKVLKSGREIEAAAREAVAAGYPTIVAAGGDGTISGVAAQVAGSGSRLGVLPFGTFNYFSRALGVPPEVNPAVEVLISGRERTMTIGAVNGGIFLNNASIGAYAAILQRREQVYRRWGRSRVAAYWSVLTTLLRMRTAQRMVVTVDGEEHRLRTPLAFIARNAYQLEGFGLPGGESVRDGRFALFIAPNRQGLALLTYAFRLAFGQVEEGRDFRFFSASEIRVETKRKRRLVARDGEKSRMTGPFEFVLYPEMLRVVVPEEKVMTA